tara:strand:- start:952 stop:1161 length:210 start_codon:yes stop_codon:yes gene_type:complete
LASELAFSPNKLTGGKMLREAYKIQNTNNHISTMGLIRMYKRLLNSDKIKQNGSKLGAYKRLKQLIENK